MEIDSNEHQKANLGVLDFELTKEELRQIDSFDKGKSERVEGQHSNEHDEFKQIDELENNNRLLDK